MVEELSVDAIRALAPALFPPKDIAARFVNPALEQAFIVMRTAFDENLVRSALDAEVQYSRRLGIRD